MENQPLMPTERPTDAGAPAQPPVRSSPVQRPRVIWLSVLLLVLLLGGSLLGLGLAGKGPFASLRTSSTPQSFRIITEFSVPTPKSGPAEITMGSDGNLWFTEAHGNQIGRITPTGAITEFPLPTPDSSPSAITAGADGNVWFTEDSRIGRITPSGAITEFALPQGTSYRSITKGPDGNLWMIGWDDQIVQVTLAGAVTVFPLSSYNYDNGITTGPDGNLWFTEHLGQIGRMTPSGQVTDFPLPGYGNNPRGDLGAITLGPDGNLWFTEYAGQIGRMTPSGQAIEFAVPTPSSYPLNITAGPEGALWFTERDGNRIGRITPSGIVTEFPTPTIGSPEGIAAAPDGSLWFTEFDGNKIGRSFLTTTPMPSPTSEKPGFQRFSNGDFSILYPSAWSAETISSGSLEGFTGPQEQSLLVGSFGPDSDVSTDPAAMAPGICSGIAFTELTPVSVTQITIGGQEWAQADCGQFSGGQHLIVDWVIYKGNLYAIAYSSFGATFASDRAQFFSPMEQSFQFLG